MPEISTNIILDGISLALRGEYPDSQIESDAITQGLKEPAFIILLLDSPQTPRMQRTEQRWQRSPRFDILYFPKSKNGREECYMVADNLSVLLDCITLPGGDKIRGSDISFNVIDDVLHFNITYKHHAVLSSTPEDAIESIETNIEVS